MKITGGSHRGLIASMAGGLLAAVATAIVSAPTASAAPDCSADGIAATVSSVTGSANTYLSGHPGANQALSAAYTQPRPDAAGNIRAYFTAHPQEYFELRGILAPIGDSQRACNVPVLSPELASAYSEFMAG